VADITIVTIVLGTCIVPFAFVIAMVLIKAHGRNRELAQIMEERRLMIERGMQPPPLKLPAQEKAEKRDPLANLKAGVVLVAVALGLIVSSLVWPNTGFMGGHQFAQPAAVVVGILGLGFIVLHVLVRAYAPQNGAAEPADPTEEEGY
jgi:hypothetical protein